MNVVVLSGNPRPDEASTELGFRHAPRRRWPGAGDGADRFVPDKLDAADFGGKGAAGHHRFFGAADVDGDARARSPEHEYLDWNELVDDVLLPRGLFDAVDGRFAFGAADRTLTVPMPLRASLSAGAAAREAGTVPESRSSPRQPGGSGEGPSSPRRSARLVRAGDDGAGPGKGRRGPLLHGRRRRDGALRGRAPGRSGGPRRPLRRERDRALYRNRQQLWLSLLRLLAASDDFLTRYSGPRSLALSARAEILDRLGRREEAWDIQPSSRARYG